MNFEPITFTVDQLTAWAVNGYVWAHLIFGLVTHYHSVLEVRTYNKNPANSKIGSVTMLVLFVIRMCTGLPWFVVSRLIAPVGNIWHKSADQIDHAQI